MSDVPPTGDRLFRNEVIRIADLTVNTVSLERLQFWNCRVLGPAVLLPQGQTAFTHCTWEAPNADAVFWEVSPGRTVLVGVVAVIDCTFSGCTLSGIGVAGPPELRQLLEQIPTQP